MLRFKTFLSEAAKSWLTFSDLPRAYNPELKTFMVKFQKVLGNNEEFIYIDDKYDFRKATKQLTIKITDKSLIPQLASDSKLSQYGFNKVGDRFISSLLINVALTPSGGIRGTGRLPRKGQTESIPTTAEQELGTIKYFEAAMKGKRLTARQVSDLVSYDFGSDWLHNFSEQYEAFNDNIGSVKGAKIYLDSGKNDSNVLINLAKKFGLKDLKDNWNPADIWVMTISKAKVLSETKDINSLEQFNGYMLDKYNSKEIIGISLKKVPKTRKAKFSVVSTKDMPQVSLKPSRVLFDPYQKNFIFETEGNISGFNLRVGYKAGSISSLSDIRIYLEGRQKGAKVQLGGVSSSLFPKLALANGFDIAADKKKIFADPMAYINSTVPKLMAHPVVVNKMSALPDSEIQIKAAAFLTYYLQILLESDNQMLNSAYYSSSKMNDFSAIHIKLY